MRSFFQRQSVVGHHHSKMADQATGPADELANLRAAVLLPEQLLHSGEVIILLIKPSPWYILLESMRFLAMTALLLAIALLGESYWSAILRISRIDLILFTIAVCGLRLVWQFLEWLSRVYVLTDRRVIRMMGVLRIQIFETQLKRIQHTVTLFSIRERMFGLGTIGFATAGTGAVEATWRMVGKPLEVHRVVLETLNRYQ